MRWCGCSIARLTLLLVLLLVGWTAPVYAGPTSSPSDPEETLLIVEVGSGAVVVIHATSSRSAWCIQYAYCGDDPVNRMDPSGLDWEWIAGEDATYLRGTDIKLWTNANGYWSFVPGKLDSLTILGDDFIIPGPFP